MPCIMSGRLAPILHVMSPSRDRFFICSVGVRLNHDVQDRTTDRRGMEFQIIGDVDVVVVGLVVVVCDIGVSW